MSKGWKIKTKGFIKKVSLALHTTRAYVVMASVLLVATGVSAYYAGNHANLPTKVAQTVQNKVEKTKTSVSAKPTYISGSSCQSSQLSLGVAGGAATGLTADGLYFEFTNTSDSTCTLDGYPTFVLKTSSGNIVSPSTSNIVHGNTFEGLSGIKDPGSSLVTIEPSESAYFAVAWSNDNSEPSYCTNSITLESVPPNNSISVSATLSNLFSACDPGGTQPASTVYITAIGTLGDFGLESCPASTNASSSSSCTPIPQPVVAPKPVTLLDTTGQRLGCTNNVCTSTPIPMFTPTTSTYTINFSFTSYESHGGNNVCIIIGHPDQPLPAGAVSPEVCSSQPYGSYQSGEFSTIVNDYGNLTPVQLNVYDTQSWHITVTENSQALYPLTTGG